MIDKVSKESLIIKQLEVVYSCEIAIYKLKMFKFEGAKMLRTQRKMRLMTQVDLAKEIKVKQSTVSMWETGKAIPSIASCYKLAEVLNMDLKDVMDCFKR